MKKSTFVILVVLVVIVLSALSAAAQDNSLGKEYKVKVIDDHEVWLVNTANVKDTIILLLENATSLAEERVIYVKANKGSISKVIDTGKVFTDVKGVKYPILKTANNKLFYWKTSTKTGNKYKVYVTLL